MPNKLPKFLDNHKICIICEGNEEFEYLKRLKILKVWNCILQSPADSDAFQSGRCAKHNGRPETMYF